MMRSTDNQSISHTYGSNFPKTRAPIAWFQRDINLTQSTAPRSRLPSNQPVQSISNQRPSSPSLTTTSSDDRDEVPMVRHPFRRANRHPYSQTVDRRSVISRISKVKSVGHQVYPPTESPFHPPQYRTGTVRSSRSVPGFIMAPTTWDGEPCPLHGCGYSHTHLPGPGRAMQIPVASLPPASQLAKNSAMTMKKYNSLIDLRAKNGTIGGIHYPIMTISNGEMIRKIPSYYPTPVPVTHIPLSQSHHNIYFQQQQQQRQPFPLSSQKRISPPQSINAQHLPSSQPPVSSFVTPMVPIGDKFKLGTQTLMNKDLKMINDYQNEKEDICCKGHLIVLWIILAVVTVGVISGIILGITV